MMMMVLARVRDEFLGHLNPASIFQMFIWKVENQIVDLVTFDGMSKGQREREGRAHRPLGMSRLSSLYQGIGLRWDWSSVSANWDTQMLNIDTYYLAISNYSFDQFVGLWRTCPVYGVD